MAKFLCLAAMAAFLSVGALGCNSNKDNGDMSKDSQKMSSKADACSHCPGTQTATADGKCPVCGMKVKS